jgi:hypothetical protein
MSEENFIIFAYCCIADFYNEMVAANQKQLTTRGFAPKLADAEVITIEIRPLIKLNL